MPSDWRLLPVFAALTLAITIPALGGVSGKVLDPNGKRAPNALVTLRDARKGTARETNTSANGEFRFDGVSPGFYKINACGTDFAATDETNVGPSPSEASSDISVELAGHPLKKREPSYAWILILWFLGLIAFVYVFRVNPYFIRVPFLVWCLWAPLFAVLWRIQAALIALQPDDAQLAGGAYGYVGVLIALTAFVLAKRAETFSLSAWQANFIRKGKLHVYLPHIVMLVLVFAPVGITFLVHELESDESGTKLIQLLPLLGAGECFFGCLVLAALPWLLWYVRKQKGRDVGSFTFTGKPQLLLITLAGLVVYLSVYWSRFAALEQNRELTLGSPLTHLLFLLAMACSLLSMLSGILDRVRIPLFIFPVLLISAGVVFRWGDYTFKAPVMTASRPFPEKAIGARDRIIVVAAAGGGVQAAAWTARVLGGMADSEPRFRYSVRALSGVSGGSVGVMYFANTYPAEQGGNDWTGQRAFQAASLPMLDAVAWGLVNVDFPHAFVRNRNGDRGAVLSKTLAVRSGLGGARLSQWSASIDAGMPAVMLNATEVETGRPLIFSSTRLTGHGIVDFADAYQRDLEITTAVRLSATFPLVSPAARLEGTDSSKQPFPHVADGGYYDNYGMYSLMAWVREALGRVASQPDVLFLRIESFPPGEARRESEGWPLQIMSPLVALNSVRGTAQQQRNETEFLLLQQRYRPGQIKEQLVQYQPPCGCGAPPLSWDLSPVAIDCVDRAFHNPDTQTALNGVRAFLARTPEPRR